MDISFEDWQWQMYIRMLKLHCYIYKAVQHALHSIFFTQSNHIACQRQIFCLRYILFPEHNCMGMELTDTLELFHERTAAKVSVCDSDYIITL